MSTVQFDPRITTDLQIDWRRRPSGHGSDLFADLLADRLKARFDDDRRDPDARRPHPASDALSGRPPRVAIAHERTLRGEARVLEDDDRCLTDHRKRSTEDLGATPAEDAAATEEVAAAADPMPDGTVESRSGAGAAADQPAESADDQTGSSGPSAVVATQPAEQAPAPGTPVMAILPAPAPAEGESVAPEDAQNSADLAPDGSQSSADEAARQQAVAAMIKAGLSEVAVGLNVDNAAATGTTGAPLAVTRQSAAPAAPAATEEPFLQMPLTIAPAADPTPARVHPQPDRPAMDIKLRPGTPARPHAGAPDPAASAAPQSAQSPQSTLLQPRAPREFGSVDGMPDPLLSSDGSGPGWTLHLAQGAAGKRADFVAQLRQHLQNLPAHEQVAVHIQRAAREGTGKLSVQLSPAELGRIHVKLEIDEDKRVSAAVTVERPSTLELLQRDIKGLERALHGAGLTMEGGDLSFSLGRGSDQEFAQDLNQSAASAAGGPVLDAEADGNQPTGSVAVMDTAAGMVNLQV